MNNLSKTYDPGSVEQKWYKIWEEEKLFTPSADPKKKPFTIVIPPPNVTGSLHMGHALNNTIQDILIRWKRMQGYDALWVPGTDHAGIATQNVVERELKKEGMRKEELGREEFLKRVWKWKDEYGGRITKQLRRLGAACDWTRERFTMDEGLTKAVRRHFVQLFHEGLIYRGKRIINWCPRCKTALSDIETIHETVKGHLWYIRYKPHLTVATTRPETLLGDIAVAVNPEDARFKKLVGQKVILPLVNQEIPIIGDSFVDPSFGTGAVKVTPAHDPNDYEMALRHNLAMPTIMDESAKITHPLYAGLDRFGAREKIVENLKAQGLLEKIEDYETSIGHCYRCKTIIEPYLSDQWFVKMRPLAVPALAAVREGKIRFVPDRWTKVYVDWMENIRDWCISRQIWWGHRIPVWYCQKCGEHVVPSLDRYLDDPQKCAKCSSIELGQDPDVLDTWFSSALWPFSTLGWPEQTGDLKRYYPTDVLVTSYDIISFWVARMIVSGIHFMGRAPFHTVYIHGLIRDVTGKKMSKSLGNVIDPVDVIDHTGADALRFALTSLITGQGQDIKLSEQKIIEARNFANKIWNAARFVAMTSEGASKSSGEPQAKSLADQWILSRYHGTIADVTQLLGAYDFGEAARTLYKFIWSEFCDWYLEISKIEKNIPLLQHLIIGILHLLHPFMPFITEEIYSVLVVEGALLKKSWPVSGINVRSEKAESDMEEIIEVIAGVRNYRGILEIPQNTKPMLIANMKESYKPFISKWKDYIMKLSHLSEIKFSPLQGINPKDSVVFIVRDVDYYLTDIGDTRKAREKIIKKRDRILTDFQRLDKRLTDKNFLQNAKQETVESEREKRDGLSSELNLYNERIRSLG